MSQLALGLDPGRVAGAALVAAGGPGERPRLVAAAAITASRPRVGTPAAATAEETRRWWAAALALFGGWRDAGHTPDLLWLEEPPPVSRRGQLAGDRSGQRSWLGLGRRQGLLTAACVGAWGRAPERVPQPWWVSIYGTIPTGKRGDGAHRIQEAALYVEGAREALAAVPAGQRVDVAEAVLIAAAALYERPGLGSPPR